MDYLLIHTLVVKTVLSNLVDTMFKITEKCHFLSCSYFHCSVATCRYSIGQHRIDPLIHYRKFCWIVLGYNTSFILPFSITFPSTLASLQNSQGKNTIANQYCLVCKASNTVNRKHAFKARFKKLNMRVNHVLINSFSLSNQTNCIIFPLPDPSCCLAPFSGHSCPW